MVEVKKVRVPKVTLKLTEEEYEKIKEKAESVGLNISSFLRMKALSE